MTNDPHQHTPRRLGAALVVALLLAVLAAPAVAQPLVDQEGILEVGTIDPYQTGGSSDGSSSTGSGTSSSSWSDERCVLDVFGSCIFTFREEGATEETDVDDQAWHYYDYANSSASGYYIDVLGGVVFARASSGAYQSAWGSGSEGDVVDRSWSRYENNLGYSEEHSDEQTHAWDETRGEWENVSRTDLGAGAEAPVGGGEITVARETDGESYAARDDSSAASNASSDEYFGVPVSGSEDAQTSFVTEESRAFWERTQAGGNVYLVNPSEDGGVVEIVGLRLDQGERSGEGESESGSSTHEATSVFGLTVYQHDTSEDARHEYAFFEEWLRLEVDLVSGTVSGDVAYDRGAEESYSDESSSDETELVGVPAYGESHEATEETSREWRDVSFALDAAEGTGVITLEAWDEDSDEHRTSRDAVAILGMEGALEGEESSSFHSDGLAFGLDVGDGVLWLGASYENRTSSESGVTDFTFGGAPLAGFTHESDESWRGVRAGAGSSLLGVDANAWHENSSESQYDALRVGGEDLAGVSSEDEHSGFGADADARGLFVFSLVYSDGRSDDAVHLAGVPLGVRNDYRHFGTGVGGEARGPTDGQHLFSYSFEHEETSDDYDVYADETTIGGARHNATRDSMTVIVLDGAAHASLSREFSNTQVFAGEDTEVAELGLQQGEADVGHGDVDAGGQHVDEGGATASVFLAYVEAADAIAFVAGLAAWCVDPAVALPYDAVLGALPPDAQMAGGVVVGLVALAMCFGAPVLVPLFLASPCIVVPLATGTVFLVGGTATSLLPAGGDVASSVLALGEDTVWDAYDEHVGCVWLTIPDVARNPQPVLAAMHEASETSDTVLAAAWTVYDQARVTAYQAIDMAFAGAGALPGVGEPPQPPAAPEVPPLPTA